MTAAEVILEALAASDSGLRLSWHHEEADAILAALAGAGFAVVPRDATNRMMAAGGPVVRAACGLGGKSATMDDIWRAMVAAAEPREGGEACAADVDCGCVVRREVLERLATSGEKRAAHFCTHGDACCALQAAAIRARKDTNDAG